MPDLRVARTALSLFGCVEAGGTKFVCGLGTGPDDLQVICRREVCVYAWIRPLSRRFGEEDVLLNLWRIRSGAEQIRTQLRFDTLKRPDIFIPILEVWLFPIQQAGSDRTPNERCDKVTVLFGAIKLHGGASIEKWMKYSSCK